MHAIFLELIKITFRRTKLTKSQALMGTDLNFELTFHSFLPNTQCGNVLAAKYNPKMNLKFLKGVLIIIMLKLLYSKK